jgi:hypothetical protein
MVRKTRRHSARKSEKGIASIPELRRAFEHIEDVVDRKVKEKVSKEEISKELRKEWQGVFFKALDKKSADAYVEERMTQKGRRVTRRSRRSSRSKGGAQAIAGAPLDYMTRQGVYLAPGQIPIAHGHLPLSSGAPSAYGSYVQYVDKGFWNPEPGQSYDPVAGQPPWPVVPAGMGSNAVKGGRRSLRRGGSLQSALSQMTTRPFSSSVPSGVLEDMQSGWYGIKANDSPSRVQNCNA